MYQVGIIGLGIMGRRMLADCQADPRFSVASVWDLHVEQVNQVLREYPQIQAADDAQTLIARADLDLIYIATPPTAHIKYAHLALNHAKAVLCEKPLSVDFAAAQQLVERATDLRVPNALNFMYGEMAAVRALNTAVRSGELGKINAVEAHMHFPAWPRAWQNTGVWLAGRKEGGFIREVYSHYIYLLELLCGPSKVIWRQAETTHQQTEVGMMAFLQAGETPVRYMGNIGGAAPEHIVWTIYGTFRSYRLWNWTTLQISEGVTWNNVDLTPTSPLDEIDLMLRGEPHLLADFALGLRVQHIIEAITGAPAAENS